MSVKHSTQKFSCWYTNLSQVSIHSQTILKEERSKIIQMLTQPKIRFIFTILLLNENVIPAITYLAGNVLFVTRVSNKVNNKWSLLWFVIVTAMLRNCLIPASCSVATPVRAVWSSCRSMFRFSVACSALCTRKQLKASSIFSTF
jgi:hypothetical protein